MTLRKLAVVSAITLALGSGAAARQAVLKAHADIKGDKITGTAAFMEVPAHSGGAADRKFTTGLMAVEITVTVDGLTPGPHGIHLHAVGKCEAPGFTTAGGHFDPGPNGVMDPDTNHPFHMGDLPNLVADAKGHATMKAITTRVTLGDGPVSLFDADGSAIIVHQNPDQGVTGESKAGLSGGPRAACGVIVK
jgi:Cu-Zn family superoxide dismutase